jgi:cytochrome c oxidase cbb3-type subunit 1
LYGALSVIFFGTIYFMVPRLTGVAWLSGSLTAGHRFLVTIGVIVLVVALAVAGWTQGTDLLNAKTVFADVIAHTKLPLLIVSGAQLVLLGANVLFLVNFLQSITTSVVADVVALNPIRETTEASAS